MRESWRVIVGGSLSRSRCRGCQLKDSGDNVVNGKMLFAEKCGTCHVLERAGATGTTGPDLDAAFAQSRADGLGESTFEGVVLSRSCTPTEPSARP